MAADGKQRIVSAVSKLSTDLRQVVEEGRRSFKSCSSINDFVLSRGPDEPHGLYAIYPVSLYAECFRSAGVVTKKELEEKWSQYFQDLEVRECVEELLAAEDSYKLLIQEIDNEMQRYEDQTAVPPVPVGENIPGDLKLMEATSGEVVPLQSYYVKANFTLFILPVEARLVEFEHLGCQVVVVASGAREGGIKWIEEYGCSLPLLLDREQLLYKYFGMRRLVLAAWDINVFIGYAEAVVKGRIDRMGYSGDDVTVIGGDFIVESSGKLMFSYRSKEQYDRPGVDNLLSFLRKHNVTQ